MDFISEPIPEYDPGPNEQNMETLFWYTLLYNIGSHIVKHSKIAPKDDLTKLFCGYWVLWNMAANIESESIDDIIAPNWC